MIKVYERPSEAAYCGFYAGITARRASTDWLTR